ncbi:class I lanthipeptide [Taibaiella koreensis]|uniref:class I lanthipeptide n=1 Tax=Taibaiella koreensis TaxID=1268548 RepID=UPI000E59E561
MKKKKIGLDRKLIIRKETISSLNPRDLVKIAGGDPPSVSCPGTVCPPQTDEKSVCRCIMSGNLHTCKPPGETGC